MTTGPNDMNLPLTVVEVRLRRTHFTGYAVAVHSRDEVVQVIASLQRPQCYVPHAYRLLQSDEDCKIPRSDEGEGGNDDGDKGVADKLLHLLRQWDVENVLVAVRRDESRSLLDHDYLGARRYKIFVHCAKAVLQLCYAEQEPDQLTPPKKVPCDLTDSLPVDRDVDSCGVVRVAPPGQINNFKRDVPARRPTRGALTNVQRSEIRFMRRPHNDVHVVLRCVCALLDGTHWLDDRHKDWIDVRSFLTDAAFNDRFAIRTTTLLDNRDDDDDDPANHAISNLLRSNHLGPKAHDRLRAKSTIAAHFFPWLWSCLSPPRTRQDEFVQQPDDPCQSPSSNDDDVRGLKLAAPSRPCDATFIGGRIEAMPSIVA